MRQEEEEGEDGRGAMANVEKEEEKGKYDEEDLEKVIWSSSQIQARVEELGILISRDFAQSLPLLVLGVSPLTERGTETHRENAETERDREIEANIS